MVAFSYTLESARVNAQTILSMNRGTGLRTSDSFEFCWYLVKGLVHPQIESRSQNGLSSNIQMKMSFILFSK